MSKPGVGSEPANDSQPCVYARRADRAPPSRPEDKRGGKTGSGGSRPSLLLALLLLRRRRGLLRGLLLLLLGLLERLGLVDLLLRLVDLELEVEHLVRARVLLLHLLLHLLQVLGGVDLGAARAVLDLVAERVELLLLLDRELGRVLLRLELLRLDGLHPPCTLR